MKILLTIFFIGALTSLNAFPARSGVGLRHISMSEVGGNESYSAKDYVQDGLVCMWDGIENVDWGVHDPNTTVWVDLMRRSPDISIMSDEISWSSNALVRIGIEGKTIAYPK